jgi:hypothetical protein
MAPVALRKCELHSRISTPAAREPAYPSKVGFDVSKMKSDMVAPIRPPRNTGAVGLPGCVQEPLVSLLHLDDAACSSL